MGKTVTVVVNNQQTQMLDRLVAEGFASTHAEVIAAGFRQFCETHAELLAGATADEEEGS